MYIYFLFFISIILSSCVPMPVKPSSAIDEPLIQIPVNTPPPDNLEKNNTPFQDISFSNQHRYQVLTNKMAVEAQTDQYVKEGQADIITRPDGTILYPYGLAAVSVEAKRMMYSKILLQEGEKIMSAAAGDTARWLILPDYIGDAQNYTPVILVKPLIGGLQTSLSIITDKRDYDITLHSVERGDYMPRIGFYYPQDKADALKVGLPPDMVSHNQEKIPKIDVEHIKYDYRIKGSQRLAWYPAGIFEDGHKVFIRMPDGIDHAQLPVFMMISRGGEAEMVNYRYVKPYYVIDTIFDRGVLMLGTDRYRETIQLVRV